MQPRHTLNVSLTARLDKYVKARVAGGNYQSASEVIREALRLMQERERSSRARLESLRSQIQLGLDQARRGELIDGEAFFDELEAESKPVRRASRKR